MSTSTAVNSETFSDLANNVQPTTESVTSKSAFEMRQVYMSVAWSNEKVGITYYDFDTTELYMMHDVPEIMQTNVFKRAFSQIQPMGIIASTKDKEKVIQAMHELKENVEMEVIEKMVHILPSIDFAVNTCKNRLHVMISPNLPKHMTESEKCIHISTLIQTDNFSMMKSLGGLLRYLEKNRIGIELEAPSAQIPVLAFKTFTLKNFLMINENSFRGLEIFVDESHPSGLVSTNEREGFSLFSVLNKCKSAVGSRMLREWFKHPLSDINTIKMRHKAVEYFCRPSSFEIVQAMQNAIKNMKNIAPIMKRMLQAQCNHSDWKTLHKTIIACVSSYDILSNSDFFDVQILAQLGDYFRESQLISLANLLSQMVDFEETDINQRFTMKFGIDEDLDEKKRIYDSLSVLMLEVCRQECQTLPSFIQGCNVVYFPQIGFLTSIEETENMKATKDYTIPSKEYLFEANGKVYYKSELTRNLDRKYGDLRCIINDMEMRHMHYLQNKILESSSLLMNIISCFAEIDCLLSFAYCARVNNYVKPLMVADNIISIKNGRHPLLELRDTFVPNDVSSGSPHRILIITAANASGKSVYLKQVGLIVFMAQIGSFVPADSATLGIITEIFTRLCTVESIAIPMSSFLIDLNNVALALKSSTARSLILLDEFGQGTQEEDGAALLAATIKSLDERGGNCPHLIVSTHFHILIHSKVIEPSNRIKFMTLAIMVDENDRNSPLTYLHELKNGYADCSYALNLAKMVGLPQKMIDRAHEIWECKKQGLPIMPDVPESDKQKYVQIFDKFLELNVEDDEEIISFIEFVKSLTFEVDM